MDPYGGEFEAVSSMSDTHSPSDNLVHGLLSSNLTTKSRGYPYIDAEFHVRLCPYQMGLLLHDHSMVPYVTSTGPHGRSNVGSETASTPGSLVPDSQGEDLDRTISLESLGRESPLSLVTPFRRVPIQTWNIGFISSRQPQIIAMFNSRIVQIKFMELLTTLDISTPLSYDINGTYLSNYWSGNV